MVEMHKAAHFYCMHARLFNNVTFGYNKQAILILGGKGRMRFGWLTPGDSPGRGEGRGRTGRGVAPVRCWVAESSLRLEGGILRKGMGERNWAGQGFSGADGFLRAG